MDEDKLAELMERYLLMVRRWRRLGLRSWISDDQLFSLWAGADFCVTTFKRDVRPLFDEYVTQMILDGMLVCKVVEYDDSYFALTKDALQLFEALIEL